MDWGCRIHCLHLCREVRPSPPSEFLGYDIKQLLHSQLWICEIFIYVKNVHNVHNALESEKTKHLRLSFWFRYETFYYLFEFKVFRHEERETQFLAMLTVCTSSALDSRTQPTRRHPADPNWSRLGELRKSTRSVSVQISTQLTFFFFKFQNPQLIVSEHDVIHVPGFYCDICDCHILPARSWTTALNVCT